MSKNRKLRILAKVLILNLVAMLIFVNLPCSEVYAANVAIGTDGKAVDLGLWSYTCYGDTYTLNHYNGSYIDGKIVGCVPATINGKPVSYMSYTFRECRSLKQAPKIPDGVRSMWYTFADCRGLTEAPEIPNGVRYMYGTFSDCRGLTKASKIPNSVTDMTRTFFNCTALLVAPEIPDNVTSLVSTFSGCKFLTRTPEIPNNIMCLEQAFYMSYYLIDMNDAFYGCSNLTGDIFIPVNATSVAAILINTSKPITMIYSENNSEAVSYKAPSNITKVVDSERPYVVDITDDTSNVTITSIDNYGVSKYAITTTNTIPTRGWQSSNVFSDLSDGTYYAWAMDKVGNVSDCKAFTYPQSVGTDGKAVDLNLWRYRCYGDTYSLEKYVGDIVDGKIIGSVPATINRKPVTDMSHTFAGILVEFCFYTGCPELKQAPEIPDSVTNMEGTFDNCTDLIQAPKIPNSVTNMQSTFYNCTGLMQAPKIPNSITNMQSTFYNCKGLTQAPEVPNSVTNMSSTFYGCSSLKQVPNISTSVTNLNSTFGYCTALTQVPEIPNSVTDMSYTFYSCSSLKRVPNISKSVTNLNCTFGYCTGLIQAPEIPNSVTNMDRTFGWCSGLTQAPEIPNSVTDMFHTFNDCTNLTGDVFIPNKVTNMSSIFYYTSKPITMIYSVSNSVAASYYRQSNVTKVVDSAPPEISTITAMTSGAITINATDNYGLSKYAITTTDINPNTSDAAIASDWQSSNTFLNLTAGTYYAWAMDRVGNISECQVFKLTDTGDFDSDGKQVDLSLWNVTCNGETYSIDKYVGNIIDGKIIGSVPAIIKVNLLL